MSESTPTLALRLAPESLDDIALGVLRVSLDGGIHYLNRAAVAMLGSAAQVGDTLSALDFDPEGRERLRVGLARRSIGRGAAYALSLLRGDTGARVSLRVSSVPDYDADGHLSGAALFLTDTTMEAANRSIHAAIAQARDRQGLLAAVTQSLHQVIGFDAVSVALVSEDRRSLRSLFEWPASATGVGNLAWRWWPMPEFVRTMVDELSGTRADSLDDLFAGEAFATLLHADPGAREFLSSGYRHLLRHPIVHEGKLVALLTLQRRAAPFGANDVDRFAQLPLDETINMVRAIEREEEGAFALTLVRRLALASHSIAAVAQILVEDLRSRFGWARVSLFRVDRSRERVALVRQSADEMSGLPDGYEQAIDIGVIGQVVRTRQVVRLGDAALVDAIPRTGGADMRSQLCLPVPGPELRWIVDIESPLLGAFTTEEQRGLEPLLDVAGLILERTNAVEFRATVLESMADAVFQTSSSGVIHDVNPAALRLLGTTREALAGRNFASLIVAPDAYRDLPDFAARIVAMERLVGTEFKLLSPSGEEMPVLLSGSALPEQVGGKVYVASDLRNQREAERMEGLRDVQRRIAAETRLPLTLTASYLRRSAALTDDADMLDLLDKSIKQLQRADFPLERLLRLASEANDAELALQPVDLKQMVRERVDALPKRHWTEITLTFDERPVVACAAAAELGFCADEALAFFLSVRADGERLLVRVFEDRDECVLAFGLIDAATSRPPTSHGRDGARREFELAGTVTRDLMKRMHGQFQPRDPGELQWTLRLQAWPEAAP